MCLPLGLGGLCPLDTHPVDTQPPGHTPPSDTHPWTPLWTHPRGYTPPGHPTPVEMAIEAGGMHPTRMQSCYSMWVLVVTKLQLHVGVHLHWRESKSDIASRWVHRKSNLMFALSSDEDQRKYSFSFSVNEPVAGHSHWEHDVFLLLNGRLYLPFLLSPKRKFNFFWGRGNAKGE